MFTTGDFIRSLQPVRGSHTDWAFYVQEATTGGAVRVRAPYGILEQMPNHEGTPIQEACLPELSQPLVAERATNETALRNIDVPMPRACDPSDKREPSDIELVITTARRIETFLENNLSATGSGLITKLKSIPGVIPIRVHHRIRYIAIMRNKVAHVDGFFLRNRKKFIHYATTVDAYFASVTTTRQDAAAKTAPDTPPAKSNPQEPLLKPGGEAAQ
jgi:hypothetical protein